ncbi:MAG: hypothetical protein ACE5HA_06925 [Anaerolineae bacterium]
MARWLMARWLMARWLGGWMARRRGAAMAVGALVVALAFVGCSPQVVPVRPTPGGMPATGDAVAPPSLGAPQPPSLLANPSDESSATPAPPPPTEATGQLHPPTSTVPTQPTSHPANQPSPTNNSRPTPDPAALTPTPTPTPVLRRLTTGGCCTQPYWSADSQHMLFIDKPAPDAPIGIWSVDVTQEDLAPKLITERIGYYTRDMAFLVEVGEGTTTIERLADGKRWTVPAEGRPVSFSPSRTRIAWQVSDDVPFEQRVTQVWVANMDGTEARSVAKLPRGSLGGWISEEILLLSNRETLESREQVLFTLSLVDGATVELVRSERLRGGILSPDRRWMAYYIALSDEPAENGLWLVSTDGKERRQVDRQLFGAYQWRDAGRLLIIPFRPDAVSHEIWELNVETGETRRLTDPTTTPFKIANGDWEVSPDGRYVAFVESRDRNIWVLDLGQ